MLQQPKVICTFSHSDLISEGFFVARLHKKKSTPFPSARTYQPARLPFRQLASDEASKIVKSAADAGLRWNSEQLSLWQRDNEIWLFPSALTALFGRVRFSRSGLRLAECFSAHYRWQHEAVIALCDTNSPNLLELNAAQAEEWYRGRDIYPDQTIARDEVIVTFQHQPLGLAKKIGNRLKNSYPRTLVRDGRLFNTGLNDCSPPSHASVKKSE